MNEPAEQTIIPQAAAPDASDLETTEEYIEQLFEAGPWNQSKGRTPSDSTQTPEATEQQQAGGVAEAPPVEAPPQQPDWEKRYNDLQSDMDRRVNNGVAKLRDELSAKFDMLTQAVIQSRGPVQPQQPESFNEAIQDETKVKAYFENLARSSVTEILNSDPRIAAGAAVNDYARFQKDYPDFQNYGILIEPALKWFPVKHGESIYDRLAQAYEFAKDIFTRAAQANAPGVASGAKNGTATTPQPQGGVNRVTGAQRNELLNRANQYANETGISATVTTKPKLDPYDPRKLEQNVRALVESALNKG